MTDNRKTFEFENLRKFFVIRYNVVNDSVYDPELLTCL